MTVNKYVPFRKEANKEAKNENLRKSSFRISIRRSKNEKT